MENQSRGQWGSSFGFLMAAVGSAVGLGNIWGFPYKMGANGGFAFLLVYLVLVITVGIVVMLGELALGRKTGRGAVGAYLAISKKYAWIGYMGVASGFFVLSFYSVLGGIVLRYATGYFLTLLGIDGFGGAGSGFFGVMLYDYKAMLLCYVIFMALTLSIVMGGIKGGIEKFSSIAMPALTAILIIIIGYVAIQPGAADGYAFMFKPDFSALKENFFGVVTTAAGQMFFSLSLGMGCMVTYGSYLSKNENLQRNAVIIPFADTLMAILAGCAVMPACAAFGVDFGAGPSLRFVSMQTVFANMGGFIGNIMGFMFYFLILIAALTSSISLLEVCTTYAIDKQIDAGKTPDRKKISVIFGLIILVVGLPVALDALGSGNALVPAPYELLGLSGDAIKVWNDCWLDFYDLMAEGIMMPLGAMVMSIIIGWKLMPSWKHPHKNMTIIEECCENGHTFKAHTFFEIGFKFVVPIGMAIVLYGQLLSFFG